MKTAKKKETKDALLSMEEAARLLKTTRQTLYGWLRAGSISGFKAGRQWRFEPEEIERFLRGQEPRIDLRADITPLLDDLTAQADRSGASEVSIPHGTEIQRTIGQIIRLGMGLGASHIHIHPNQDEDGTTRQAVLRYRVDGILRTAAGIDMRLLPPLLEQWKVLVSLDPKETRRQQERSMRLAYGGNSLEIQCQFSVSALGETLTVGSLRPGGGITLSEIGFSEKDYAKVRRAIEAPSGLVIFASPAASGRTTTLYACLNHLAGPTRKIMTIEDRVERTFPWLVQLTLHVHVASSFPFALRHFQHSDAEVVMVDYMPDKDTIESAQFTAMSGRLVLAGFHAPDAVTALVRMAEMGSTPNDIAEATTLVVSQRLVRCLCDKCAQPETFAEGEQQTVNRLVYGLGADAGQGPINFRKAVGCEECRGTGYRGRTAIAEAVEITPDIAAAIRRGAGIDELRRIAMTQGLSMRDHGIVRAMRGETSLSEVRRVMGGSA